MGLDTTHDCWHGSYSSFNRWRQEIARAAGLPPLDFMEGFYEQAEGSNAGMNPFFWARKGLQNESCFLRIEASLPIRWDCLKPSPLHKLLNHSDCDGELAWQDCEAIADSLDELLPKLMEDDLTWTKTIRLIAGLRLAANHKENVEFR